jgi:perosamine synthetase
MKIIQLFKPSFGEEELEALREPFDTGWIGLGPKTSEFEEKFAKYVGAKYAIALNSATAALHLALNAFGVGEGDEVLLPPITFVSTVHAVIYCGATPVFVDVYPDTLCIDVEDIKRKITEKTKAIIPVHYGGHPCEINEIMEIAQEYRIVVVEDAAHACGAEYRGCKIGCFGDATCFSFHAVKNLATGDGGMITTDRLEIAKSVKRLRWVGIDKSTWERTEDVSIEMEAGIRRYVSYGWYYEVNELGYKYHMNDIAAAIGLVQLSKLDRANAKRRAIIQHYNNAFRDIDWIEIPVEKDYVRSAHHNYVIKSPHRDELNLYLKDKGIATGVHYMPVHLHPFYRKRFDANVPVSERIWTQLLTLPLYPDLTDEDINYVIDSIKSFK